MKFNWPLGYQLWRATKRHRYVNGDRFSARFEAGKSCRMGEVRIECTRRFIQIQGRMN